ncbi:hypothetical protein AXF42_Ash016287 [Apostasia shenzhenica]|uniref:Uncharacterized protein n=1 Tax=Apostasia shenzhenica TaxID=1088818 RepID=A0A2H9ZXA1_9ASPA|nr:hypothetical protein AXF42_Ash016287 [Apostasia shenzhenica]
MGGYQESLKAYWKRRAYENLDGDGAGCRRRVRCSKIELGGRRRRRFWRIKASPKLRFPRVMSPKRFLGRIRDAYVRMMLRFDRATALTDCGVVCAGFGVPPLKEYDDRLILQIYGAIAARNQQIAAASFNSTAASGGIALRRAAGVAEIALQS